MRFSKVRITDHRTPATGVEHWQRLERKNQHKHDKSVRLYSRETAAAALADLSHRPTGDKRDPEHHWIRHRRAALQRKIFAPELCKA